MRHVAVIGCGHWGKNLERNFAALGALRIVCDTDSTKLAGLKDQYPDVRATTSYRDLLSVGPRCPGRGDRDAGCRPLRPNLTVD